MKNILVSLCLFLAVSSSLKADQSYGQTENGKDVATTAAAYASNSYAVNGFVTTILSWEDAWFTMSNASSSVSGVPPRTIAILLYFDQYNVEHIHEIFVLDGEGAFFSTSIRLNELAYALAGQGIIVSGWGLVAWAGLPDSYVQIGVSE